MQDRYTGDLGDFSKLGILRVLQMAGLSIGVNWYLTPDENHNNDGCHVKYLEQDNYRACDEELWLELKDIVEKKNRKTCFLEKENILRATFFSEKLDFTDKAKPERTELRKAWHIRALAILQGTDIVCVDPDNGLIVPSAVGRPKENKYVLPNELADYYAQHSSVIYYQHKARRPDEFYIQQHEKLLNEQNFKGSRAVMLKFRTTSQRYYFFIVQPKHQAIIEKAITEFLSSSWRDHFMRMPSHQG